MYADFFGFRELPFNNTPDPRFFYSTPDHEEALASLIYAVTERKGFVLLTGEVGAGKTLVTRMMLRHFGCQIAFANINHAVASADDLMESICTELELPVDPRAGETQLVRTLHDYLLNQFAQNIPVVLLLDEAQNLPVEGFERLRMIGNLESDDAKLLQIAIVGQPELQRLFVTPELRQLRQRVFRSFHLPALSCDATEGYILHRLTVACGDAESLPENEIFTEDAVEAIYRAARGLPRVINTICDNALLSAYSGDLKTIDGAFIDSVVEQMMLVVEDHSRPIEYQPHVIPRPGPRAALPESTPPRTSSRHAGVTYPPMAGAARPPISVGRAAVDTPHGAHDRDALADRVATLEARYRKLLQQTPPSNAAGDLAERLHRLEAGAGTRHAPDDVSKEELVTLNQDLSTKIEDEAHRIDGVEARMEGLLEHVTQPTEAHELLQDSLRQAHATVDRAEEAQRELDRREDRIRTLAGNIRDVIEGMRQLLRRVSVTTNRTKELDRNAHVTHDRLTCQTRLAQKLIRDLARFEAREQDRTPRFVDPTPGADNDAATTGATPAKTDPPSTSPRVREQVRKRIESVCDSLADLRTLAVKVSPAEGNPLPDSAVRPTDRLAHQVHDLLSLIEPQDRGATSPSEKADDVVDESVVCSHTS